MKKALLRLYYWFRGHRRAVPAVLAVSLLLMSLALLRLRPSEDITAFLPEDPAYGRTARALAGLGFADEIVVTISPREGSSADRYMLMDAADTLAAIIGRSPASGLVRQVRTQADPSEILSLARFVAGNLHIYSDLSHNALADSLLSREYVSAALDRAAASLRSFGGMFTADVISRDPLMLSSETMESIRGLAPDSGFDTSDGYFFTPRGELLVFVTPVSSSAETMSNRRLTEALDAAAEQLGTVFPQCKAEPFGAAYVSVLNADTVKRDTMICVIAAAVLLVLLMRYAYGSARPAVLLAASLAFGTLFALAVLAVLSPEVSLIALGTGSVLIGIAANYPLHFIDHRAEGYSSPRTVSDIFQPLTVGNVTTVGAFLSLLFISSPAMKNLGLYAASMLVGTLLFVLVFLPQAGIPSGLRRRNIIPRMRKPGKPVPSPAAAFAVIAAATVAFAFISGDAVHFDGDLSKINYMTPSYRTKMAELQENTTSSRQRMFYVCDAPDADSSLSLHWNSLERLAALGRQDIGVAGAGRLFPPERVRRSRTEAWNSYWAAAAADFLPMFDSLAAAKGFGPDAFAPFREAVTSRAACPSAEDLAPVSESPAGAYLPSGSRTSAVSLLSLPKGTDRDSLARSLSGGDILVFDSGTLVRQMVSALEADFDKVLYICSLLVLVFLFVSFGRAELVLIAFTPLFVGWIWILGIMELTATDFNIVNIILATFIFGMGDDYTIFMLEGASYEYAYGRKMLGTYRETIALSALTMFIGIGSLVLARHPAMQGLAYVTIIGMAVVVLMAFVLPPYMFRFLVYSRGVPRKHPVTFASAGRVLLVSVCAAAVFPAALVFGAAAAAFPSLGPWFRKFLTLLMRAACRIILGRRVTWDNRCGEDFSRPAVVICNHQSQLDILLLMALSPRLVPVMNSRNWKLYAPIAAAAGFIPASGMAAEGMDRVRQCISRGDSLLVFPEGTRSSDCRVGRFHKGAFEVASALGLDVVCAVVHGTGAALGKGEAFPWKFPAYCGILRRIPQASLPSDSRKAAGQMRRQYEQDYAAVSSRLEDLDFAVPAIRAAYMYKGRDVWNSVTKLLSDRTLKDRLCALRGKVADGRLDLQEDGCGALSLAAAMTMKDVEVYAVFADRQDYDLVSNMAYLPSNLHPVLSCGDVLVGGGGMSGLVCGALLSSEGYRVTVLEKQRHCGGGLSTFMRCGRSFDAGAHTIYGFGRYGAFGEVCRRTGISPVLRPVSDDGVFERVWAGGRRYDLPCGRKAFEEYLAGEFPHQRVGLGQYLDYVYGTASRVASGGVQDIDSAVWLYSCGESLAGVLERYVSDGRLREVLSWVTVYTGLPPEESLFTLSATVTMLLVEESCRLEGGVTALRKALEDKIVSAGGSIVTGMPVESIEISGGAVRSLLCRGGRRFAASAYIAAAGSEALFSQLAPEVSAGMFRRLGRKLSARKDGVSMFSAYAVMKDGVPASVSGTAPVNLGGRLVVVPYCKDGLLDTVQVHMLMPYSCVAEWEHSVAGARPGEYEEFKARCGNDLMDEVESVIPGFRAGVRDVFFSTPLTIRDYLGRRSAYGRLACASCGLPAAGAATPAANLFLTGGEVRFHGLCGVPATCLETAGAVSEYLAVEKAEKR